MKHFRIGAALWLLLAVCLYFFENNTGTRTVLLCSLLLPLLPFIRRAFQVREREEAGSAQKLTVSTFSHREEEDASDLRAYRPGDPVNRIHWKLSAKKGELMVRQNLTSLQEESCQKTFPSPGSADPKHGQRRRAVTLLLITLVLLTAFLLLLPVFRESAQALLNRLFALSEQFNTYRYERFPVAPDQSAAPAAVLLSAMLAALLGILILSRSRPLALGLMAGSVLLQVYFGLSLPDLCQVLLFSLFLLFCVQKPLKRRDTLVLLALILAVFLAVALIFPGVDPATEAASETVRDALSQAAGGLTGSVNETAPGEHETRHLHPRSLVTGSREAGDDREFRLATQGEQQISDPPWAHLLRIILLLLLTVAVILLPFLPFMWAESRRKKALEAQKAFSSDPVREAVPAIFRQIIAWLETFGKGAGNLLYREWGDRLSSSISPQYAARFSACALLFEEAAYSDHDLSEAKRQEALDLLHETEQLLSSAADWKMKLRLKYGECLWI